MTKSSSPAWPFADDPKVAVFAHERIVSGDEWIYYVGHDEDDGAWQFHPESGQATVEEAKVVSLASVLERDPSIGELADLPLGWCAWREERGAAWERMKQEE
jgi:hypothetical protein